MSPSSIRKAIAAHMTLSKQSIPHYYLTTRVDVTSALERRKKWNAEYGGDDRISINDLIVKAVTVALEKFQIFNGYYVNDAFEPASEINIGIAIALSEGLIAPAILDCKGLTLDDIARRSRDRGERAKQGKLRSTEYTGATFTVSNLGMYNIENFIAIIVPPQVGILSVGAVSEVLLLKGDELKTSKQLLMTLSGDHRATDGAEGALFLGEVVSCLENVNRLFSPGS